MNLHKKPEWFLKLNPLGKVPCLHYANDDARVLPESGILCEYLDEVYADRDGARLLPADPYLKAVQKLDIEVFNKTIVLFYQVLRSSRDANDEARLFEKLARSITRFEAKLKNEFLAGDFYKINLTLNL